MPFAAAQARERERHARDDGRGREVHEDVRQIPDDLRALDRKTVLVGDRERSVDRVHRGEATR